MDMSKLTKRDWRVLFELHRRTMNHSRIDVTSRSLERTTGIALAHVNESMRHLAKEGIIKRSVIKETDANGDRRYKKQVVSFTPEYQSLLGMKVGDRKGSRLETERGLNRRPLGGKQSTTTKGGVNDNHTTPERQNQKQNTAAPVGAGKVGGNEPANLTTCINSAIAVPSKTTTAVPSNNGIGGKRTNGKRTTEEELDMGKLLRELNAQAAAKRAAEAAQDGACWGDYEKDNPDCQECVGNWACASGKAEGWFDRLDSILRKFGRPQVHAA